MKENEIGKFECIFFFLMYLVFEFICIEFGSYYIIYLIVD